MSWYAFKYSLFSQTKQDIEKDTGRCPIGREKRIRRWTQAELLDMSQTGTSVTLHNSWVDSYGRAIYDWVAFMSTGEKAGRGMRKERQEEKGEKMSLSLKEIILPLSKTVELGDREHLGLSGPVLWGAERMIISLPFAAVRKHLLLPRALLVRSSVMSMCVCTSSLISSRAAYSSPSQYSLSKQSISSASCTWERHNLGSIR